jgi:putative flippase GtrA
MDLLRAVFRKEKTSGLPHFIRYALVSGIALVADVAILALCHSLLDMHYLLATTLGFVMGVIVNYTLCIWWVFTDSRFSSRTVEFTITMGIAAAGLVINDLIMWLLIERAALYYLLAKIVAAAAVFFWNFVIRHYYVHTPVPAAID